MRVRSMVVGVLVAACVATPLAAAVLDVANPFDTRLRDPRARVLGHVPYRIAGGGMAPAIPRGTVVLVDVRPSRRQALRRGDVAMFHPWRGEVWIKRVVGLPGETVALRDGLRIDGAPRAEPYVDPARATLPYSTAMAEIVVPRDAYFLLGDARDDSDDSRRLGPVPRADIAGVVVAVLASPPQAASYAP